MADSGAAGPDAPAARVSGAEAEAGPPTRKRPLSPERVGGASRGGGGLERDAPADSGATEPASPHQQSHEAKPAAAAPKRARAEPKPQPEPQPKPKQPKPRLPPPPADLLRQLAPAPAPAPPPPNAEAWVRNFAHVEGNWPSHVFASVSVPAAVAAAALARVGGAAAGWVATAAPHLSLSRPFVLRKEQFEPFERRLRHALRWQPPLELSLGPRCRVLHNDEGTRRFAALVGGDCGDFARLTRAVDGVLQTVEQPGYYAEPVPHVSVASALPSSDGPSAPASFDLDEPPIAVRVERVWLKIAHREVGVSLGGASGGW